MKVIPRSFISLIAGLQLLLPVMPSYAQTTSTESTALSDAAFNPHSVLDDRDLFDFQGMTLERVKDFLASRQGILDHIKLPDIDGQEKTPADIVWRVATSYKINPKYLLALIQKEQSLVDDPNPTQKQFDWAAGYAICDNCSMNDPSLQEFKGFASQLEWAAKQHREKYLLQILGRGKTIAGQAPGKTVMIDGRPITPLNQATAMLYSYTPHIAGNFNLWRIWQRWFSLNFTDGMVVRGRTSDQTFLIRLGQRRPFKSEAVVLSMFDPKKIATVEDSQLNVYPLGNTISFPNYSLVENQNKRYLISGESKRLIVNAKTFRTLGFNEDEVVTVQADDLAAYTDGPDITLAASFPLGRLFKDPSGKYWNVQDSVRHAVDTYLLALYFKGRARPITKLALEKYKLGEPYTLKDGELIKTKNQSGVFILEHGLRRPIASGELFESLGLKWNNVITLPANALDNYPLGQPLDAIQSGQLAVNQPN